MSLVHKSHWYYSHCITFILSFYNTAVSLYFLVHIAECIQEKYWVWWEKLWAVLISTGNRIFFPRAMHNHDAMLFPMIARPLAKCIHTYTCTWTCAWARHGCVKMWFTSSTKYSEGRSERRDIRHPRPGVATLLYMKHPCLCPSSCAPCTMD